ncbi:MAG: hypothetical protein H6607_04575 [Flavobacteriales bacterium]|nr:hypothetical protein [Flavobacteriales bacterium]
MRFSVVFIGVILLYGGPASSQNHLLNSQSVLSYSGYSQSLRYGTTKNQFRYYGGINFYLSKDAFPWSSTPGISIETDYYFSNKAGGTVFALYQWKPSYKQKSTIHEVFLGYGIHVPIKKLTINSSIGAGLIHQYSKKYNFSINDIGYCTSLGFSYSL